MADKERIGALQEGRADHLPPACQGQAAPSMEFQHAPPELHDEIDLRDYLDVIVRRRRLIGSVVLAVFATALIVTLAMTPVFKATGRLEFNLQPPRVTKFEDMVVPQTQTREFMNTQSRLLASESLAMRVIEALDLAGNPEFNDDLGNGASGFLGSIGGALRGLLAEGPVSPDDPGREAATEQRLLKKFSDNLEVKAERDATILNLAFSSPDPALARDVVNTLIRSFITWQMDKKVGAAGLANEQLQRQIELARVRLEKSEKELNTFAQKAGIVSLDSRMNLVYRQLEEINSALAAAQAQRLTREALYAQASESGVSSMPMVIDNELIQRLRQQHVELVSRYEDMLVVFKPGYPEARRLKAKLDDVAGRVSAEEERILQGIRNDYQAAAKNEEALRKQSELAKSRALELNDRATQYQILAREVETNKDIHQSLLQRVKEIDATVGADISNVQIVDHARIPVEPDFPRVRLTLILAIVLGLLLGVVAALLLEFLDNTVKSMDEISDRFGISILGVLPEVEEAQRKKLDHLVALEPRSGFSEAIRTTRVSIQLSSAAEGGTRSLLVTSTCEGEGKSTIAVNMAQAFAAAGDRVLIIDSDLRRPRLHRVFPTVGPRAAGLSELLTGSKGIDEVVRSTEHPNLFFLPAGLIPPNPAELLASRRMRACLEQFATAYDRIIVDGPPSVGFADVLVLGSLVSGVILVTTLGRTHRHALRLFKRSMSGINARLLGTVVNRLDAQSRYGGYYSNYYRYSYYSYAYGNGVPELPQERQPGEGVRAC